MRSSFVLLFFGAGATNSSRFRGGEKSALRPEKNCPGRLFRYTMARSTNNGFQELSDNGVTNKTRLGLHAFRELLVAAQ